MERQVITDRQVLGVEDLSEEEVRDIAATTVPEEYAYLNELLDGIDNSEI